MHLVESAGHLACAAALAGPESSGDNPTILLVHGFGASAYHWRYNIPALVEAGYRVFAVDLLGFGWSDKAITSYDDYSIWQRQLSTFVRDVVRWDSTAWQTPGGLS